jgi:hypothetical protein
MPPPSAFQYRLAAYSTTPPALLRLLSAQAWRLAFFGAGSLSRSTDGSFAACAQQCGPMRRIDVLMPVAESDPQAQLRIAAFQRSLAKLGRNVRLDHRSGAGDIDRDRAFAVELVGLRPDVLLAAGTTELAALRPGPHLGNSGGLLH